MGNEQSDKDGGAKGADTVDTKSKDVHTASSGKPAGTGGRSLIKQISSKGKGNQAKNSANLNKEVTRSDQSAAKRKRAGSNSGGDGTVSPDIEKQQLESADKLAEMEKKRKVTRVTSDVKHSDGTVVSNNNNGHGRVKKLVVTETSQVVEEKSEILRAGSKTPTADKSGLSNIIVQRNRAESDSAVISSTTSRFPPKASIEYDDITFKLCSGRNKPKTTRTTSDASENSTAEDEGQKPSESVCESYEPSSPDPVIAGAITPSTSSHVLTAEEEAFNNLSFWRKHVPPLSLRDIAQISLGSIEEPSPCSPDVPESAKLILEKTFQDNGEANKVNVPTTLDHSQTDRKSDIPTPTQQQQHHFRLKYSPDDFATPNLAEALAKTHKANGKKDTAQDEETPDLAKNVDSKVKASVEPPSKEPSKSSAASTPNSGDSQQLAIPTILRIKDTGEVDKDTSKTNTPNSEGDYFDCHSQINDSRDDLLDDNDLMITPDSSSNDAVLPVEDSSIGDQGLNEKEDSPSNDTVLPSEEDSQNAISEESHSRTPVNDEVSPLLKSKKRTASSNGSDVPVEQIIDRTNHEVVPNSADIKSDVSPLPSLTLTPPKQRFTFETWAKPHSEAAKKLSRSFSFDEVSFFSSKKESLFQFNSEHEITRKWSYTEGQIDEQLKQDFDGGANDVFGDKEKAESETSLQRPQSLFTFSATPYDRSRSPQWRRVEGAKSDTKVPESSPGKSPRRSPPKTPNGIADLWSPKGSTTLETPEKDRQARLDFKINFKEQSNFSGKMSNVINITNTLL